MFCLLKLLIGLFRRFFSSRENLLLENLALRQQLLAFKRRESRPNVGWPDKLFWVIARRLWSEWKQALVIVTPETVVRWHRTGFRLYWSWLSRHRRVFGRTASLCLALRCSLISAATQNILLRRASSGLVSV